MIEQLLTKTIANAKSHYMCFISLILASFCPMGQAESCDIYQRHMVDGITLFNEGDYSAAKQLFMKASDGVDCADESYYWEEMAEGMRRRERKHYRPAENKFSEAVNHAPDSRLKSVALARRGESQILRVDIKSGRLANALAQDLVIRGLRDLQLASQISPTPIAWVENLTAKYDFQLFGLVDSDLLSRSIANTRGVVVEYDEGGEPIVETRQSVDVRLLFDFDSAKIPEDYSVAIEMIAKELGKSENEHRRYRLVGHSDVRGEDSYNMDLSLRRARAVEKALAALDQSLDTRIEVQGMGKQQPIYRINEEDKQRLNRRIEIIQLAD